MPVDCYIFVTLNKPIEHEELAGLRSDLAEVLGERRLLTYEGHDALSVMDTGDFLLGLPDGLPHAECILQCTLCTPYYGPGYERGYWPEIVATLEYLNRRCTHGEVWYGRDDGNWVQNVTPQYLDELWNHWATYGGRPYYQHRPEL